MLALFRTTVLLGAGLLFLVEPMVAKMLLPFLGGGPAVWNSCMVFFQVALLAGYGYAHLLTQRLKPRAQLIVHGIVLSASLLFLPIGLSAGRTAPAGLSPVPWLLGTLAASVGVPFFVLASTAPLLQRWFVATDHARAADPYFLYGASNLGSLCALLGYPLIVEPMLRLTSPGLSWIPPRPGPISQSLCWSVAYVAVAGLVVACGLAMRRSNSIRTRPQAPTTRARERKQPAFRSRIFWVLLAFAPSSLLLGVTQYLTSDIASIPLLWVLPLALYLLTFVLAFSRRSFLPVAWSGHALAVLATATVLTPWVFNRPWVWLILPLHLLTLFAAGLVCHGRLAAERPAPERLTEYYLLVALGGALGGVFNALVAPLVFNSVLEYPIALVLTCLLRPGAWTASGRGIRTRVLDVALPAGLALAVYGLKATAQWMAFESVVLVSVVQAVVPSVLCLGFLKRPLRFALGLTVLLVALWAQTRRGTVIYAERTFFGVHKVKRFQGSVGSEIVDDFYHNLVHGETQHGGQFVIDPLRRKPTTYYHPTGPIGRVFEAYDRTGWLDEVAVIGCGAGTLAAYGRPGRHMTIYEIDPEVVRIARDARFFTYLRDSRFRIDFVLGDGRLALANAPDGRYGLIVVDAFSSDAIPIHLMTREAWELYLRKLRPGGLLALHLTGQYSDLSPVADALASDLHLAGLLRFDDVKSLEESMEQKQPSLWAILARNREILTPLLAVDRWEPLPKDPDHPPAAKYLWTDDFSNILAVLRAR